MTPFQAFLRLHRRERPFLLESGSDADGCGRYSFCGSDPVAVLEWRLGDAGDPFAQLERAANPCIAVGFLGYGLGAAALPHVPAAPDPLGLPELAFAFYDAVWRYDHQTGRAEILGPGARMLAARLKAQPQPVGSFRAGALVTSMQPAEYTRRLERLLEYIHAGDVYQMNLTHALEASFEGDAVALYAALRRFAAPFGGYLDLGGGRALVANSPERFLRADCNRVESRPIKGTRSLDRDGELERDDKERAEHLMIVDLLRNDLGRVCDDIRVEGFRRVVRYPTLSHLISTVLGRPRAGLGLAELLRATFPGGSVTGAPKIRAMQLISELELLPRGAYTGAFGRIGPGPELDLAMTIRTAVVTPGRMSLGVGGGIVADSRPDAEWAESLLKARAFARALRQPDDDNRDRAGDAGNGRHA